MSQDISPLYQCSQLSILAISFWLIRSQRPLDLTKREMSWYSIQQARPSKSRFLSVCKVPCFLADTYIDLTGNTEALIKRIVATAGDTVEVKNNHLFVNGNHSLDLYHRKRVEKVKKHIYFLCRGATRRELCERVT